ncbi:MAG: hypothetical protein CMA72_01690 [Euryarchaeota archaeon]|nr:hypothetical protein [Euryarchaeota archaeon]
MANRRTGAKTEVESSRKKADLSLPPAVSPEKTRRKPKTVTPVRPKPVTPTPSNRPKPVTPTPSNRPKSATPTPERPPTVVKDPKFMSDEFQKNLKIARNLRNNPLPKIGNDLVKMNKGGKIRGYGMARGGKVCKMR